MIASLRQKIARSGFGAGDKRAQGGSQPGSLGSNCSPVFEKTWDSAGKVAAASTCEWNRSHRDDAPNCILILEGDRVENR